MMNRRGVTLTEVLVVSLVLTLVGGVFFTVSTAGERVTRRTELKLANITVTQRAFDRLVEDLDQASAASLQCACPSPPCPPGERTIQFTQGAATVLYQRTGSNLTRTIDGGAPQTVAGGLAAFEVIGSCTAAGLVTVAVTADVPADSGVSPYRLQSSFFVRNP
ncbi:MAG: hypothetical protein HYY90_03550 [Candidatus Omnitrophica bacterium]|nr:hypothetical protein [Candidatus Omnitrophota bacterium]MBI2495038.1 hypothetical protein [Candidatus Omnitrophota bacterium]MBI3021224.1 hypothetical protein [Candidatus Omnitrophota bacterium]MBI3083416.1 hypothetical protein [Candidatus Omnitrophota bacterium]